MLERNENPGPVATLLNMAGLSRPKAYEPPTFAPKALTNRVAGRHSELENAREELHRQRKAQRANDHRYFRAPKRAAARA